jgi:hypothetical protein
MSGLSKFVAGMLLAAGLVPASSVLSARALVHLGDSLDEGG